MRKAHCDLRASPHCARLCHVCACCCMRLDRIAGVPTDLLLAVRHGRSRRACCPRRGRCRTGRACAVSCDHQRSAAGGQQWCGGVGGDLLVWSRSPAASWLAFDSPSRVRPSRTSTSPWCEASTATSAAPPAPPSPLSRRSSSVRLGLAATARLSAAAAAGPRDSRRRDCHSAAAPSTSIRCFNRDKNGGVSKMTVSPTAT